MPEELEELVDEEVLEDSQEEEQVDDEEESWITDEVKDEAKSYGLNSKDLEEFGGLDEFERAGRLMDMQAQRLQSTKPEEPTEKPESKEYKDPFDIEQMKESNYDETSLGMAGQINSLTKAQFESVQTRAREEDERAQREQWDRIQTFHDTVDEMNPEFFGKSRDDDGNAVEISKVEDGRRSRLFKALGEVVSMSPGVRPGKAMYARAARVAFEDERAANMGKARARSNKRRPTSKSSSTNQTPVKGTPEDVANSPAIVAAWRRYQRENGDG